MLRKIAAAALSLLSLFALAPPASGAPALRAEAKTSGSALSSIETALKADKSVADYAVSHDAARIAVARRRGDTSALFILTVATRRESAVPMSGSQMCLYGTAWSFDDRYVSVHDGTAAMNLLYVVDASAMRRRLTVNVVSDIVWAPASRSFAFMQTDPSVPQVIATELDGAEQLKIYNMDTLIWHRYIRPDPRYVYTLRSWSSAGLAADRYALPGDEKTPLLLKVNG